MLCSRNAMPNNTYITGMRVLVEVKQSPVRDHTYQAMVVLLLAIIFNPKFKPVVVLTDLHDRWVFFWTGNRCIWHSAQNRATPAGIIQDMLEDGNVRSAASVKRRL